MWIVTCARKGFPKRKLDIQLSVKVFLTTYQRKIPFKENMSGDGVITCRTWNTLFDEKKRKKKELKEKHRTIMKYMAVAELCIYIGHSIIIKVEQRLPLLLSKQILLAAHHRSENPHVVNFNFRMNSNHDIQSVSKLSEQTSGVPCSSKFLPDY
ncbi:hypothetical protein C0J52_27229 [Blattella germanica]|nr:hypothetical protein C0J52_27229 [Blattella germanica]